MTPEDIAEQKRMTDAYFARQKDPAKMGEFWQAPLASMASAASSDPAYAKRITDPTSNVYNEAATWLFQNPGKSMADYYRGPGAKLLGLPTAPPATTPPAGNAINYYNQQGNPYTNEEMSFWRNPNENAWYWGNKGGHVQKYGAQAPWEPAGTLPPPGGKTPGGDRPLNVPPPEDDGIGDGDGGGAPPPPPPDVPPPPAPPPDATPPKPPATPGDLTRSPEGYPYYNLRGDPYRDEDKSYWYNTADKAWYQGDKSGQVNSYGLTPPWERSPTSGADTGGGGANPPPGDAGNKPLTLADLLGQLTGGGGGSMPAGALSLLSLLGAQSPKSWNTPGLGYGYQSRQNYWNEAGRPFQEGQDKRSYWYNRPDRKWYSGDLEGKVTEANQLPWAQVPWMQNNWQTGDVQYLNAQGRPFGPGDEKSYWYNKADQQWYEGSLDGNIKPVTRLPWK